MMEGNGFGFGGGGVNGLSPATSFERRNNYANTPYSDNNSSNANNRGPIGYGGINRQPKNEVYKSMDGRDWATKDQAFVANKELYNKIGKEVRGEEVNHDAFNLNNFYKYNQQ